MYLLFSDWLPFQWMFGQYAIDYGGTMGSQDASITGDKVKLP